MTNYIDTDIGPRPKRGRPKRDPLEMARAAWWARGVQFASRKGFAELERKLNPTKVRPRDTGGFTQPYAWDKYARGERIPTPPTTGKNCSPILLAEQCYRGTSFCYFSITWDVLKNGKELNLPALARRVAPEVMRQLDREKYETSKKYGLILSPAAIADIANIRHLDVLGLMLMQWRGGYYDFLRDFHVYYAREWLLSASRWIFPFRMTRNLLLPLIEERVPELGILTGPLGMSLDRTVEQQLRAVHRAMLLGQRPTKLRDFNVRGTELFADWNTSRETPD